MFVGTMVANFGSYLYHLVLGRMLGPQSYGTLESVISLGYLIFILINTLTLVVAKFTADLKGKNNYVGIAWLWRYFLKQTFYFSVIVFMLIVLISPSAAKFLHLDSYWPIILIAGLFVVSALANVYRAVLQGTQNFLQLTVSHIGETSLKMLAAMVLVYLGLGVNGAVLALIVGAAVGLWLADRALIGIKNKRASKPEFHIYSALKFSLPVLLANLCFTSLYTSDIILVKHFFPAYEAGLYASLAVLGKVIYFATSSIPAVVFPMAAESHSQGNNPHRILKSSFLIVLAVDIVAVLVYSLWPQLMIKVLFGDHYLEAAGLMVRMGIFIALYSLAYLMVNYLLSINQVKVVGLPIGFSLLQLILISVYHQTLQQVITMSIICSGLLLFGLMLYYLCYGKKVAFGHHTRI